MKTRVAFFILFFASLSMMQGWAQVTIWQQGNGNVSTSCGTVNAGRSVSLFGNTSPLLSYSTTWAGESIAYVQSDNGWGGGSGTKGWKITVNTTAFQNMSVSFKPMSYNRNGQDFGPRDWKMQYSLDNSTWTDVGVSYSAQDLWSSGTLTRTLPAACNNQSTVYLRWIMTSNVATDGGTIRGTGTGPASAIGNIKVTGSEIPLAPSDISLSANQVTGIGVVGRVVGSLSATDPNECGGSFTYSLVAGTGDTDNSNYQITGNTLKVKVTNLTGATNSVRINVNDGTLNYAKIFTINVTQPSAPTDIQLSSSSVHSAATIGTVVGTLSVVDADAGDSHTYSLVAGEGSTHNNYYEIAGNQLKVKVSPLTGSSNTIRINVNDGIYNFSKSFNINIDKYCTSWADFIDYNYFTNVSFNTIDNTTGRETAAYGNYTGITTNINKGSSYELSLTHVDEINDPGLLYHIMAWIDWNQNGNFDDSGEGYEICTNQYGTQTFNTTITVPSEALAGLTRMRIATRFPYGVYPEDPALFPPSCGLFDYGEVEDYTLNIVSSNPTVSSVAVPANAIYKAGQNLDFTINFGEAVTVNTTGGTPYIPLTLNTGGTVHASYVSGSGTTAIVFRYTVVAGNQDNDGITVGALALNGGTIKNGSGTDANLILNSVGSTTNVKVDAVIPTATIVVADNALRVGETSLVTITFSEAVTGFTNADLTIANGTLTAVSSSDGGVTWTATLIPTASLEDPTNVITLDNAGILNAAGNAGTGTTNSNNYSMDTKRPTASMVVADNALRVGETSLVTITFSEAVTGFTNADLIIANGTLTAVSSSDGGATWTATLTPTASVEDPTNVITLDNTGILDAAGNAGTGTTNSNNYSIDTKRPTASMVVADNALRVGETSLVTITFSEAVTGFSNADLIIANGTLAAVSSSDGGVTWTATLTPTASVEDPTNVITLDNTGILDAAGNAGTGTTNSNNYSIDTKRPTASMVVADNALRVGETSLVTITFSEAVTGFTNADLTIANGTLTAVSSSDGGVTWTATLIPTASLEDPTNVITLDNAGILNAAGNAGTGTTNSNNYSIDTKRPTASMVVADNALRVGETSLVTITFSEAVTGFTNADLIIANGTLAAVSSSDGGVTWTATLTPTASVEDPTNVITLDNTGILDAAGNAGTGTTNSNNYSMDTKRPTASMVVADNALRVGETSLVTITFSEAVTGFSNADLIIANGTLAAVSSSDGGVTWTATLTPTASVEDPTNVITLDNTGILDAAGNAGTGTTNSNNYSMDTKRPAIASVGSVTANGSYKPGDIISITITFSEAVNVTGTPTLTLNSGGTATYLSGNSTNVLTFNYTVGTGEGSVDLDYISINSLLLAGGAIKDAQGNDAALTLPTVGGANSLGGQKDIVIITNPTSGGIIAANQTGCYPFNPNEITSTTLPSGHVGTLEYKWQYSTTSSSSGFNDLANSNTPAYDPGVLTVDTWFKRLVRVNEMGTWVDATASNVVKMTVVALPSPPTAGSNSYTYDGTVKTATANVGAGETIDWYASATGNTPSSIPTGTNAGTYSAYAETRNTTTGCVSASRTLITLEITKAPLTVTADAKTKVYGQANPGLTFQYSGWKNGDDENDLTTKPSASTTVSAISPVGIYNNAITLSGAADENYAFTYIPANFEVTKAMLTVTADSKTMVYGQENPTLTFTYSGWKNGDDENDLATRPAASTTVAVTSPVGIYNNAIILSGAADENYAFTYIPANFEVTKAMLTVTADSKTKVYGQANPGLTFQYSGWQNGDDESDLATKPSASTTIDVLTGVGVHTGAITIAGGVDENYAFTYVPANFEVTKAMLTVTADSKTKVYGQANPGLTFQYSGWKNGDDENDLITKPSASTTVSAISSVGIYNNAITLSGAVDENYAFTYIPANFEVTKAMLTVTADAKTKVYGQENPTLTFTYSGWKNGDDENDLATKPIISTTVDALTGVGVHAGAITIAGAADENYAFTYIPADFEVTKAMLTVTADAKTKVYGQANPGLTFQYSGWQNGDDENDLTTKPSVSTTVDASTGVGVHAGAITIAGGVDENYTFTYDPANFEVTKAMLTVTADSKTKVYGQANPGLTFQYSGWQNGDDESDLATKPSASTTINVLTGVGIHAGAIIISGGVDENYAFTYVPANFEVTKAMLTVTADAKTKVYGQSNPSLSFQYSGWQNRDDESDLATKPVISTTVDVLTGVGVHAGAITVAGGLDENYAFTYIPANFEVTKAMLTVTADSKTKVYGQANPGLTFQYSGWQNGDDENDLTTKPSASTTVDASTGVGVHAGAITVAGGVDENYAFTYIPANFEVTKAMLTVTADAKTKVYGQANPGLTFQYSGWQNGDDENDLTTKPVISTTVDASTGVGVQAGSITVAGGLDENYAFTYIPANFEVTKAMLTVTADSKTKVYGQVNPGLTFQYSGWKNGDDENDLATKPSASTTINVLTGVGIHAGAITIAGGVDENYAFTYIPANFEVTKAMLTVTADAKTKVYGQANPGLTFQYSGWQNGDDENDLTTKPSASTTIDVLKGVGSHAAAITIAGGVDDNYAFTYVPANLEVTKAPLIVTADSKTKVYGQANPELTFQYSGWKNGDDENDLATKPVISTTVDVLTGVGIHAGAITIAGGVDENYAFTYVPANLEVTKAPLIVTADSKTKVYGQANPELTFQYSGWKNGDDENDLATKPVISTTVDVLTGVGVHAGAITIAGGVDENYAFTYVPANLEVTKAPLIVTADSKTKVYGQANPELTFQYSGWKNGDDENDLATKPVISTTVDVLTGVGVHAGAITVAGGLDENYAFTYIPANFEVTKAMLTVTADAKTKVYGQENPTLSFSYSGWKNGDDESDLTTKPIISTTVAVTSPVGIYNNAITLSGGLDDNYAFTYIPANFEVTKAMLTVTADAKTKVYGQANPGLTFQYSGWQNGDDENDLTTKPSASTTIDVLTGVGVHAGAITVAGGLDENYAFTYVPANFEVTKAMLTVTADAKTKVYGQENPTLSFTYSGWENGDDENDLATKPIISTTVDVLTGVGVHAGAITVAGGLDENYAFTYVPANFEVTKAMLTVTADAKTKVYGQANPGLTFQYSGWKNGDDENDLTTKPIISTTVDVLTGVGVHAGAITVAGGLDENYAFTYVPANFEVTKAMLTVTADAKTKVYGQSNPTLTFTYSGWKNGDDENDLTTKPSASTTIDVLKGVGSHAAAITIAGGVDDNYAFTYVPANLEVTKAPLIVTADSKTKVYGQANPELTLHYSGWLNGDDENVLTTKPSASTKILQSSPVGTYPNAIILSLGTDENYDFTYVAGHFEVTKAPLTITADNKSKCFDNKPYENEFTVTYNGFVNGEDKTVLNGKLQFGQDALEATNPGNYTINPGGLSSINYEISFSNGRLTINTSPQPEISGSNLVCVGSTVIYRTEASMFGYIWTVSEGGEIVSGAGTNEISVKWNTAGEKTIAVTYANANDCSGTRTKNVSVNPLPTATLNGDATVCSGSVSSINIHFTGQAPWKVTYTDGTHSQTINDIWENDYSITVYLAENTSKTYAITEVTDANGCSNTSVGEFIIRMKSATLPGSIGTDQLIASGTIPAPLTSITEGSGDGTISYVWETSIDNGLNWSIIPGETGADFAPGKQDQPAWYRRITISDENSVLCSAATEPVKINLYPTSAGYMNAPVRLSAYAVKNTKIVIKGEVSEKAVATLFDIQGRVVLSKNLERGDQNILPTPGLKSGTYLLVVKDNEKLNSFKIPLRE